MGTEVTSGFTYNEDAHKMGLEWHLSFCISIKFPSDVNASAPAYNTSESVGFVEFSSCGATVANMCSHANCPLPFTCNRDH